MPDLIQREHLDTDPLECVKEQIKTATEGRMAISRYGLAEIVAERTGMPIDQAQLLVEAYCDESAAHVPAYLGREFNLFWPKVVAFIFAIGGTAIFWYGMSLSRAKKPAWLWFAIGTILFGFGLFQWVRSLESYQRRAASKRREKETRLRAKYAKPWQ
jgi:hypothetical protein